MFAYRITIENNNAYPVKLLRRHWKEVTTVAEELLVKNTLSGKEVVEVIESSQTVDSLREDEIIPKTLAAIRAQALAEIRSGKSGGALMNEPIPATDEVALMNRAPNSEEVIVINGGSNGTASGQPATPAQTPVNVNIGSSTSGPTLVNDGSGYSPEVLNGNDTPPPAEEPK